MSGLYAVLWLLGGIGIAAFGNAPYGVLLAFIGLSQAWLMVAELRKPR